MSLLQNFHKIKYRHGGLAHLLPYVSLAALVILAVLISNFYATTSRQKSKVLASAQAGYASLETAYHHLSASELIEAASQFNQAAANFNAAAEVLAQINKTISPLTIEQSKSAQHLAQGGRAISAAGAFLSRGLNEMLSGAPILADTLTLDSSREKAGGLAEPSDFSILDSLISASANLSWGAQLMAEGSSELSQIQIASLPLDLRQPVKKAKDDIASFSAALNTLSRFTNLLQEMVSGYAKNYLLVFQNTAEARPTGGFIGTYGLLRFKEGHVTSLLIESVYEIDGRLTKFILPPEPLRGVAGEVWALRDANWWPDFEMSAKNISQFYEWEGLETVDGVLALTPEVFEAMFEILGPIYLPEYDTTIDSHNFYEEVQRLTSQDYDKKENNPKEFIADLASAILLKLPELNQSQKSALLGSLFQSVSDKLILAWSRNSDTQKSIEGLGMAGKIGSPVPHTDFLLISNANVGGGKSDKYTKQNVSLYSQIGLGGNLKNILNIQRINESPDIPHPVNSNYVRIYVPKGSRVLKSSHEIKTYEELDYTVFSTLLVTRPSEEQTLSLTYQLPPSVYTQYSHGLILKSNPGQLMNSFTYQVSLPKHSSLAHALGGMVELQNSGNYAARAYVENIRSDKFFGLVYE